MPEKTIEPVAPSRRRPIMLLRIYSSVFFEVLDIASMTLWAVALDCAYVDQPNAGYIQV